MPVRRRYTDVPGLNLSASWLDEPSLRFAGGRTHPNPTTGITFYGPVGLSNGTHPAAVNVGLIGTQAGVDSAKALLEVYASGVAGDERATPFPGCAPGSPPGSSDDLPGLGYRCELRFSDKTTQKLTVNELDDVTSTRSGRDRFRSALGLLEAKLRVLVERDAPLDYVMVIIPEDLYKRARVADYQNGGPVHRDLRRAFKALAMQHGKPTQLIREPTIIRPETARNLDHPARVAWNLFTGLYFKAGGSPWAPVGLSPGSCFVGVSFYRPLGDASNLRVSVAQAFDEHGNGWVLRGGQFPWDETKDGRQPHLPPELAAALVQASIRRYREELDGATPRRVIVHKQSGFSAGEREGFGGAIRDALGASAPFDLVGLRRNSDLRLLREGQYPPLRGTVLELNGSHFLYTTGWLPYVGQYPHGHVPSPIEIIDHYGDTSRQRLLEEILILTKLNWNSAGYAETLPITLRFASLVGDVLREVPANREPHPRYAFYM